MFKVGQKVRVKQWLDMPEEILADWGINGHIGAVGVVVKESDTESGRKAYDVKTKDSKYDFFCFEGELEPIIKVGEQLVFDFIKEKE